MKLAFETRKWHKKISVLFAIPLLFVSLTAVLLVHIYLAGLHTVRVDTSIFPGYQDAYLSRARSSLTTSNGKTLIGTKDGLFELNKKHQLEIILDIPKMPVQSIRQSKLGILVASKMGSGYNRRMSGKG